MEQRKEQLKYETELLRLAWLTAVAVGGGSMSLLLGEATTLRTGLLGLGLLLILVLVSVGARQDRTIRRLLHDMEGK